MAKYTLVGVDGNAFSVMGYVKSAMRKEGSSKEEIAAYLKKVMSGDYNSLIVASMDILNKLNNKKKEIKRSMATEVALSDTLDIDSETEIWN